jgi:hypothetical protein
VRGGCVRRVRRDTADDRESPSAPTEETISAESPPRRRRGAVQVDTAVTYNLSSVNACGG